LRLSRLNFPTIASNNPDEHSAISTPWDAMKVEQAIIGPVENVAFVALAF